MHAAKTEIIVYGQKKLLEIVVLEKPNAVQMQKWKQRTTKRIAAVFIPIIISTPSQNNLRS